LNGVSNSRNGRTLTVKYAHVMNLKAYKDDSQQMVVFLLVPFSMFQAGIVCAISKMDDNLHSRSFERGRLRGVKLLNKTTRFIHQMWDEMVTMIVIEKDNKIETIF